MNKEFLSRLTNKYASEDLDLFKAIRVWKDACLTPDEIRDQVRNDTGKDITAADARELYHLGESMKHDYDSILKPFEVSKGREDLIPDNIYQKAIKLSPSIKLSMERIGENLYRDKTAKTYWTLKEKIADDGKKAIYLVAVEEPDELKKTAQVEDQQQNVQQNTQPEDDDDTQLASNLGSPIRNTLPKPSGSKSIDENFKRLFGPSSRTSSVGSIRDYGREYTREAWVGAVVRWLPIVLSILSELPRAVESFGKTINSVKDLIETLRSKGKIEEAEAVEEAAAETDTPLDASPDELKEKLEGIDKAEEESHDRVKEIL